MSSLGLIVLLALFALEIFVFSFSNARICINRFKHQLCNNFWKFQATRTSRRWNNHYWFEPVFSYAEENTEFSRTHMQHN